MTTVDADTLLSRTICSIWRGEQPDTLGLRDAGWRPIAGQSGGYRGSVDGKPVELWCYSHYETVAAKGHSRLRDPARTRHGLSLRLHVHGGITPTLAEFGVRGEGMAAMARHDVRQQNLERKIARIFGFMPEWGSL